MLINLPIVGVVVATALIHAINPGTFGVFALIVSMLSKVSNTPRRLLFLGGLYGITVLMLYLLAGFGLAYLLADISLRMAEYLWLAAAALVVFTGILEIKQFFWPGQDVSESLPLLLARRFSKLVYPPTIPGVLFLGALVSAALLACTGAPYLAIITMLSVELDLHAFLLLVLYNLVIIAPFVIILLLVTSGKQVTVITNWQPYRQSYKRLVLGFLLIILGWFFMLLASGTIKFGY